MALHLMDAATPLLAVLSIFIGLSHLASGEAYGAPTSLPWAINLWGMERHPSQIYETLTALTILIFLLFFSRRDHKPGIIFFTFLSLGAASRLLLEAWRGDSHLLFAGIRLEQVIAWLVLALCLYLLGRLKHENQLEIKKDG